MRGSTLRLTILTIALLLLGAPAYAETFEPPPRDCASGPGQGSEEWEQADEWREWWLENCEEEPETTTPEHEVEHVEVTENEDGHHLVEQEPEPAVVETLPETGLPTFVLAIIGGTLVAAGTLLLQARRA